MKVGVFTVLFQDMPFEKMLDHVAEAGCEAVEIGSGGYPGNAHCDPAAMLKDPAAQKKFLKAIEKRGLMLSALSCHGNPLHPQAKIARPHQEDWRNTVQLAEALGVERVITFSGCPGDSDEAKLPNWVTCAWPPDYPEILKWQWEEKLIPYWTKEVAFAEKHGVKMIGLEMHPGFCVYNPETLLRLRERGGRLHRRELRSEPPLLAGDRPGGGDPQAGPGDLPLPRQGREDRSGQHRDERRARQQALHRRGEPLLDLPHRRLGARRGDLEGDHHRAAPGRLRLGAEHRARGQPDEHRRGLPPGSGLPQGVHHLGSRARRCTGRSNESKRTGNRPGRLPRVGPVFASGRGERQLLRGHLPLLRVVRQAPLVGDQSLDRSEHRRREEDA